MARPLVAITLRCKSLSIPLMPMALSKPPMVVGIKQTSSAINTGIVKFCDIGKPDAERLYPKNAGSVATAKRNMIDKPERSIERAISFGVFWRLAPSTSAIILSMKVLPGSVVICTKIRSLITFVPPVTADRSPPLSRITGADSPVIADSSTLAIPSITSPSEGITSPASQTTISPFLSSVANTETSCSPIILRALICVRFLRKLSAWALPLPSAIASEKLANNTVNQSQIAI